MENKNTNQSINYNEEKDPKDNAKQEIEANEYKNNLLKNNNLTREELVKLYDTLNNNNNYNYTKEEKLYKTENNKKNENNISTFIDNFKTKIKNKKIYVDYKIRLLTYCAAFILLFIMISFFIKGTLNLSSDSFINYNENSDLDYKVYLKQNEFYETDYLGKDKIYIASLIDNILIDFKYNFDIMQESDLKFTYDIIAILSIKDETSGNLFFEKEYILLDNKSKILNDSTQHNINEQVEIDYAYYNSLANKFKQQYGVNAASELIVRLKINRETNIEGSKNNINSNAMFVKIPLTEKAIDIKLDYKDINNSNYLVQNTEDTTDNIIFGILTLICVALTIIVTLRLVKLLTMLKTKKSTYDKYVDKILNDYDRLIVENSTGPDLIKNNIIKITKFEELLDVRDNLKLPIMYYVITKHNKCCFYIKHDGDLYLLIIKAVDLDNKNNK